MSTAIGAYKYPCDYSKVPRWIETSYTFSRVFNNANWNYTIWSSVQLGFYVLGSIYVMVKVRKFLNCRNYLYIIVLFALQSLRLAVYIYMSINYGDSLVHKYCFIDGHYII
jgi:hypothetical protein